MPTDEYDVVIVGAGVGGLVCANYLSMAGLRVLVVEKNREPGGYCTSFKRRGYTFDSAIHAIQSCGPGSILNKVFQELGINKDLVIIRSNPTDTLINSDYRIDVMNDLKETVGNFQKVFPSERVALENFFRLVSEKDFIYVYSKFKKLTFKNLLDIYFRNKTLKTMLGVFLANIGSLPNSTSALAGYALFKQFLLFGGYYPAGGMQNIPNALTHKLRERNGFVLLRKEVQEIVVSGGRVVGIKIKNGPQIKAPFIVSNSDLTYTLEKLIGVQHFGGKKLLERLNKCKPTFSIYIVYLTLNKRLSDVVDFAPGLWYIPDKPSVKVRHNGQTEEVMVNKVIFCSIASKLDNSLSPSGNDQLRIMVNTKYYEQDFWQNNASYLSEELINKTEIVIPNLRKMIICKGRATSMTMRNYTLNREGSICGWLNSPQQIAHPVINYARGVKNLFFVGHWITEKYGNGGIAMVSDSGRKVAKEIIKQF